MSQNQALGQYMVDRGWLRVDHLAKALSSQAVLGGRIGTCLLEMEAITEDQLLKALAAQTGTSPACAEDLRQIPEDVVHLLSAKIAEKHRAIPFRLALGKLDVAMSGIFDLAAQDEIGFVTGKRLTVHVCTEARMWEALDRYFRIECPSRFARLLDRLNRARYLWNAAEPQTDPRPSSPEKREPRTTMSGIFSLPPQELPIIRSSRPQAPTRASIPQAAPRAPGAFARIPAASVQPAAVPHRERRQSRPTSIRLSASERMALQGAGDEPAIAETTLPPALAPLPQRRTSFEEIADRLTLLSDRDELGRAYLRFLEERFDRAALLIVRMGEVHGWMGFGPELDEARLTRFTIDFSQPSVFLNLKLGASFYLGPLMPMASHRQFLKSWNGEAPRECLVLPIRIKDRLVTFLYADRLERLLSGIDIKEMKRLGATVGGAFELCILRNKLKST